MDFDKLQDLVFKGRDIAQTLSRLHSPKEAITILGVAASYIIALTETGDMRWESQILENTMKIGYPAAKKELDNLTSNEKIYLN